METQFNSQVTKEVAAVLNIELKHATTKHAQTIGLLERTHASVKAHLKAATGEFRINWHKFLPLAVLNHNTTNKSKTTSPHSITNIHSASNYGR